MPRPRRGYHVRPATRPGGDENQQQHLASIRYYEDGSVEGSNLAQEIFVSSSAGPLSCVQGYSDCEYPCQCRASMAFRIRARASAPYTAMPRNCSNVLR